MNSVRVYDPTIKETATTTYSSYRYVPLKVTDHPMIIEFNPSGLKSADGSFAEESVNNDLSENNVLSVYYSQENSVSINVNMENTYSVKVFNSNGMMVKSFSGNSAQTFNLLTDELPQGVYFVNLTGQNTNRTVKIPVQ
jgi:hypothetical protein